MEHSDAIRMNATERYVLGELGADEADAFERHYFECAVCADDVRVTQTFIDGGRRMVRAEAAASDRVVPLAPRRERRWGWLQVAAAAILAVPATVALLMRTPAAAPPFAVVAAPVQLQGETRGGAANVVHVPKNGSGVLLFEIPGTGEYRDYEVRVENAGGKVLLAQKLPSAAAEQDTLPLVLSGTDAGKYTLVIVGTAPDGQATDIRVPFEVRR